MSIKELIKTCDEVAAGNTSTEEAAELMNIFVSILEHISNFIYNADYDMINYPIEYFHRNDEARDAALEAFSNILEEMDGYLYD